VKCPANSGGCDTPLTIAADDGLVSVCRLLLEHNADVTFKCMNEEPDGHAFTPLLYAAKNAAHNSGQRNQSDLCQLLLQYGADFNAQDAKGFTPLMWTAPAKGNPTGQLEFARMLLQFGACVDSIDSEGLTALWWACKYCEGLYNENRSCFPSDQHPNALPPCAPFILMLLDHNANAALAPELGSVSSPQQMLERCNLQRLLEKQVTIVSDDSDDDAPVPNPAAQRIRPLAYKCLASDSPTAAHQHASAAAPPSELQLRKQSIKNYRAMLRRRLQTADDQLSAVKQQIEMEEGRGSILASSGPVIKLELDDAAPDSRDRWGSMCDKCGQTGELICCESPGCTLAFHPQCVFLTEVPEGTWMCGSHAHSAVLPRDASGILRALLFKPKITDVTTVWCRQQCFAANQFQIIDDSFLSKAQALVFAAFDRSSTVPQQPPIFVVKGVPHGHDNSTMRSIEAALALAFQNPNSLSSPSRVIVRTIPDTDARVGLRGQSGLFAAVDIPKFSVLEAYRGRLRLRQLAAQSPSLVDKWVRAIYEYDITDESWLNVVDKRPYWWQFVRNNLCIDPIQDCEGAAGFGNEFMLMNDFRREDPVKVRLNYMHACMRIYMHACIQLQFIILHVMFITRIY